MPPRPSSPSMRYGPTSLCTAGGCSLGPGRASPGAGTPAMPLPGSWLPETTQLPAAPGRRDVSPRSGSNDSDPADVLGLELEDAEEKQEGPGASCRCTTCVSDRTKTAARRRNSFGRGEE